MGFIKNFGIEVEQIINFLVDATTNNKLLFVNLT